jgi:hypothetical protein
MPKQRTKPDLISCHGTRKNIKIIRGDFAQEKNNKREY